MSGSEDFKKEGFPAGSDKQQHVELNKQELLEDLDMIRQIKEKYVGIETPQIVKVFQLRAELLINIWRRSIAKEHVQFHRNLNSSGERSMTWM